MVPLFTETFIRARGVCAPCVDVTVMTAAQTLVEICRKKKEKRKHEPSKTFESVYLFATLFIRVTFRKKQRVSFAIPTRMSVR